MASKTVPDRRNQFRHFMASLATGAAPGHAIEQGLYVQTPGGVADRLVPRIDLRPASTHLIVGGIGTGKTTQLLVATKRLEELPDVHPVYVDVSAHHDLGRLTSGVLVVIAGLAFDRLLAAAKSDAAKSVRRNFRRWAEGYTEWFEEWDHDRDHDQDYDPGPPVYAARTPGVLVPPEPPLDSGLHERINALQELIGAIQALQNKHHILLLVDSLDRVTDLDAFSAVVTHDVRALQEAGVGVVLVGPLRVLFGTQRPITDRFDHTYHVPAVDIKTERGLIFLLEVLRQRSPSGILSDDATAELVRLSGGVLRDLIRITQAACEEAYVAGGDSVTLENVTAAADAFGRNLMLGLGPDEIEVLQPVRQKGTFIHTSDKDIALLVTRRVLEYGNGHARYAVHPTIEPLLDDLAKK